jgi:hypothetical protein
VTRARTASPRWANYRKAPRSKLRLGYRRLRELSEAELELWFSNLEQAIERRRHEAN